ncbi:MAG: T9SS type A sorting domain-containing protein [Bacteroidota bacterium]|nr:T9SS type A sorting domain-containing protein [Bacteroidota bacterium]
MRSIVIVLAVVLCSTVLSYGQAADELVLSDFAASGKYLNDQISGDTTALGARNNPNRTYVLKRNGTYLVVNSIRNNAWTLSIKAEIGAGKKPVVFAFKNPGTGVYAAQQFDVRGNFWLKNVALVGWSTIPADISLMPARIIQVNGAGFDVQIDSCLFLGANGALIQVPSATHIVSVTNTLFAQWGNIFNSDIGNGRPLDFRNTSIDTVIIRNCTFSDGTDRIVRHHTSVGGLKLFVFDHNTIVNSLSTHGCLELGKVGVKVTITNNLFVDNFVLGHDSTDDVRLAEFGDANEKEPNGKNKMTMVSTVPDSAGQVVSTAYVVRNNYYAVTPAVQTWYNTKSSLGIGSLIPLTNYINKKLGVDSTAAFKKDTIAFTLSSRNLVPFATWYYDPAGANKKKVNTGFDASKDFQRSDWTYYTDTLNLKYPTTKAAYKGADGGQPAGSLMWWNLAVLSVGTSQGQNVPQGFSLNQNYPNPFNPSTVISYQLPSSNHVSLKVFNVIGKEVATLVNEVKEAGSYEATFDASKLSSGIYFYQLKSGQFSSVKKMMLIK